MTEQIIKDPRCSFDIYGYTTDLITNKRKDILYGWDFNIKDNTINIKGSMLCNDILKHFKIVDVNTIDLISTPPNFNLTYDPIYLDLNLNTEEFNSRGRHELVDCTVLNINKINLMPGRRVISVDLEASFKKLEIYNQHVEKFIDELLNEQ